MSLTITDIVLGLLALLLFLLFGVGLYMVRTSQPKTQEKGCSCATGASDPKTDCHCTCGRSRHSLHSHSVGTKV
ncbi:MAG: hypothetical protein HZC14_01010 [Candidatus Niyogibacteria bacterium]|nr:hypothetical protein [Candidatus Niyogibacteria bacterium]